MNLLRRVARVGCEENGGDSLLIEGSVVHSEDAKLFLGPSGWPFQGMTIKTRRFLTGNEQRRDLASKCVNFSINAGARVRAYIVICMWK